MLAHSIVFLLTLGLLASTSAWSAENEEPPLYVRPAKQREIIGIWSILPSPAKYYRYRYVAITAEGRIGWIVSNVEPKTISQTAVIEMIDHPSGFGVQTTGWESCAIADGKVTVAATNAHVEEYFAISVLTDTQDGTTSRNWFRGVSGDLIMQQNYRLPAEVSPTGPPPHILTPAPDHLRRMTE
jgi:hypothetical protein